MRLTLQCRVEQAEAITEVLAQVAEIRRRYEETQERANHLCAGVIVGLVPSGTRVLSADPATGGIVVLTPEEADAPAP